MSRFRRLSHAIWHCQYHMIWAACGSRPSVLVHHSWRIVALGTSSVDFSARPMVSS